MKKIILAMFIIFGFTSIAIAAPVAVQSYNSPNDVTVANLESNQNIIVDAINSADGALLQTGTVSPRALTNSANPEVRWGRAFNDWVFIGLLPPTTSGTLTSTTTSGEAFITNGNNDQKFVEKGATANTYTATKWTFVDLNSNGTYTYVEGTIEAAEPATTSNSIRLARVSTNPTEVTNVRDDRPLTIQLGNQEDQYRIGLALTTVSPAALTIDPGVLYNGTIRIVKTADTSLALGTASDWATGVSERATSTKGYVAINSNGSIKFTTTAPTLTDTAENTAGELRYSVINSVNWRVISWFWMNGEGSGNTSPEASGKWADSYLPGDIVQVVNTDINIFVDCDTDLPWDDTKPQKTEGNEVITQAITPTNSSNTLRIDVVVHGSSQGGAIVTVALFQDAITDALAAVSDDLLNLKPATISLTYFMTAGTASETTFKP